MFSSSPSYSSSSLQDHEVWTSFWCVYFAKLIRGKISMLAVRAYSREKRGSLTICRSRMGDFSKEAKTRIYDI